MKYLRLLLLFFFISVLILPNNVIAAPSTFVTNSSFTVPTTGVYKLEAWGGEGGRGGVETGVSDIYGEKGYYNSSIVSLTQSDILTITIGQQGGTGGYANFQVNYPSEGTLGGSGGPGGSGSPNGSNGSSGTGLGRYDCDYCWTGAGGGGGGGATEVKQGALSVLTAKGGKGANGKRGRDGLLPGGIGGNGGTGGGTLTNSISGSGKVVVTFLTSSPTITLASNANQIIDSNGTVTLSGTASDPDNDVLMISATIGGVSKPAVVNGSGPWTLQWDISELPSGDYSTVVVTVNDGIASSSVTYTGEISVVRKNDVRGKYGDPQWDSNIQSWTHYRSVADGWYVGALWHNNSTFDMYVVNRTTNEVRDLSGASLGSIPSGWYLAGAWHNSTINRNYIANFTTSEVRYGSINSDIATWTVEGSVPSGWRLIGTWHNGTTLRFFIINPATNEVRYSSGLSSTLASWTLESSAPNIPSGWTIADSWHNGVNRGNYIVYQDPKYLAPNSPPNAPTLTSYVDGQSISDNTPTFTWAYSDPDGDPQSSYELVGSTDTFSTISYNSGLFNGTSATLTTSTLSDGLWSFALRTADPSGSWSPWAYRWNLRIDTTPPTTPTITLSNSSWSPVNVTVSLSGGSDTGSGIQKRQYKIGASGTWTDYSAPFVVSAEGTTPVYARTVDNVGLLSTEATANVFIDKSLPILTSPMKTKEVISENGFVKLDFSAVDANGTPTLSYETLLNGVTPLAGTVTYKLSDSGSVNGRKIFFSSQADTNLVDGAYLILRLKATDSASNTSTRDIKIKIDNSGTFDINSL